jgi:hypothetical protein
MTAHPPGPDRSGPAGTCGGHSGLAAEARGLALAVLDRLQPALDRLRAPATDPVDPAGATADRADASAPRGGTDAETTGAGDPAAATCAGCPVCAVLALLRGERPELAARLAEQASGLLTVLRAALDEGVGAPAPAGPAPESGPAQRRVQHIPVDRR